jgi:hypothetical protein
MWISFMNKDTYHKKINIKRATRRRRIGGGALACLSTLTPISSWWALVTI